MSTMNLVELLKYFAATFVAITLASWLFASNWMWNLFTTSCIVAGLSIIAWTIAYFIYELRNRETISPFNRAVLITGCDSGFGHLLAKRLDRFGFTVFAGVLSIEGDGAKQLRSCCSDRLRILPLDVTKREDCEAATRAIRDSGLQLWALVNNAGIGFSAPFDCGDDVEDMRRMFDVNVFGLVRMTKNCSPLLRKSSGRVVNVASVAGRVAVRGTTHYCMAKHSVRVFSDVMRRELYDTPLTVVVIEPTFYRTPIADHEALKRSRRRIIEQTPPEIKCFYSDNFLDKMDQISKAKIERIIREDVNEVINAMEAAVTRIHPKLYYRCCGYIDVLFYLAFQYLPEVLTDWILVRA